MYDSGVGIVSTELQGLDGYDVAPLCQPLIEEYNVFDSDEEGNGGVTHGRVVEEHEDCDSGNDSEFNASDDEPTSEEESVDESGEDEEVKSLDDIDLDDEVAQWMTLGHTDVTDDGLAVGKLAKVYRQGSLWTNDRDKKITLKVGLMFTCKKEFLSVMRDYCVQNVIQLQKVKNSSTRYTMKCVNTNYPWKIHTSQMLATGTWKIRSLVEPCNCPNNQHNKMATSRWVASKLVNDFKDNPSMDIKTMKNIMMRRYCIGVPNYTCWRTRRIMRKVVDGHHDEGYKLLPHYIEVFQELNPGSQCYIDWKKKGVGRNPTFNRCQICLGWQQWSMPLVYVVALKEDENHWSWFLVGLATALGALEDSSRYTVISDRHKAIIASLEKIMPQASRRVCVLHLYKNFANQYAGAWFHAFFYIAVNAYNNMCSKRAWRK